MKLKLYLTILLASGLLFAAMAQSSPGTKLVMLSEATSLRLPSSAHLINSEQARIISSETKDEISKFQHGRYSSTYQIDSMLLGLSDHKKAIEPDYLKDIENSLKSLYNEAKVKPVFRQEKVNSNAVLIIEEESNNLSSISFILVNNSRTASLGGAIEGRLSEKANAKKILSDLLATVQFN